MFELTSEESKPDRFTRHKVLCDGLPMSFESVLESWITDKSFRTFYSDALSASSFSGYRWEAPAMTKQTMSRAFEFVLVNSPGFCKRNTDPIPFMQKFQNAGDQKVICFANLRGDATMIVPTPMSNDNAYGHLAAFIRNAPNSQIDNLWQIVGQTVKERIGDLPVWLSAAGGGVAWLHVRIDSLPKYYSYSPYRDPP